MLNNKITLKKLSKTIITGFMTLFAALITPNAVFAQEVADSTLLEMSDSAIYSSKTVWYSILAVVILSIVTAWITAVRNQKKSAGSKDKVGSKWSRFFTMINDTVDVEDEASLDLNHDYDGIRELDNKIPGWWSVAFYASIAFAAVYMYQMFVTGSIPDQVTELKRAEAIAKVKIDKYLKESGNFVDENTVTMQDVAGIEDGAIEYIAKGCNACHGTFGEGGVGPNLTDDYWINGGDIKDIFYTIKYGVPDKGMISWKEVLSPIQMANIASYIVTLHGTNPENAKEPEGELYVKSVNNETEKIEEGDTPEPEEDIQ